MCRRAKFSLLHSMLFSRTCYTARRCFLLLSRIRSIGRNPGNDGFFVPDSDQLRYAAASVASFSTYAVTTKNPGRTGRHNKDTLVSVSIAM
jgi:hypothetical protein